MDDQADDGEFEVEVGQADAGKGEDDVLHREVDDGAPEGGGEEDVAVEEWEVAAEGEVDGGGS